MSTLSGMMVRVVHTYYSVGADGAVRVPAGTTGLVLADSGKLICMRYETAGKTGCVYLPHACVDTLEDDVAWVNSSPAEELQDHIELARAKLLSKGKV